MLMMIYQAVWYGAFITKGGVFIIHSSFSNLKKEIKTRKEVGREEGRERKERNFSELVTQLVRVCPKIPRLWV